MAFQTVCFVCKQIIVWHDDGDPVIRVSHGLHKGRCTRIYEEWAEQESGFSLEQFFLGYSHRE